MGSFENVATLFVWDVLALFIIVRDAPLNLREVLVTCGVHASMQRYTGAAAHSRETLAMELPNHASCLIRLPNVE
jgi:hypothetical protein